MKTAHGSCHCGSVSFRVTYDPSEKILDCNCSICRKKGFLHLIVPPKQFELLSGGDDLQEYRFNTGTAVHRFCRNCGIHPFYTPRSHPDHVDVNVRCLEVKLSEFEIEPFNGQAWEEHVDSIQ